MIRPGTWSRALLGLAVAIGAALPSAALDASHAQMMLFRSDPWGRFVGGGSPLMALYDDHTVIFGKPDGDEMRFYSAKLDDAEYKQLVERATNVAKSSKRDYQTLWATDQVTFVLWIGGPQGKRIRIYGPVEGSEIPVQQSPVVAQHYPPPEVLGLFKDMATYQHAGAKAWTPDTADVAVRIDHNGKTAKMKKVAWPPAWPDMRSKTTISESRDEYVLRLPAGQLTKLKAMLKQLKPNEVIVMNGRPVQVWWRGYSPFPGEEAARKGEASQH